MFLANVEAKREGTYVSGNLYPWIAIFKKKKPKPTLQTKQKTITPPEAVDQVRAKKKRS